MADDEDNSPEKEFADNTTLHGIGKVSSGSNCASKLIWLAIFLACFGMATWQISDTFIRYFSFNTVTNVKLEFENELNFPAVTVCNLNRFDEDLLTQEIIDYLSYLLYGYAAPLPTAPPTTSPDGSGDYGSGYGYGYSYDYGYDYGDYGSLLSMDPVNITRSAGFQMDPYTFKVCKWKGQDCTADDFQHIFTTYGNCYTFNPTIQDTPRIQHIPGAGNGLRLIFDIHSHLYTEDPAQGGGDDVGMKVLVHDQKEPPKMDTQGIAVGPGSHAFIAVSKIEYQNEVPPWGECEDLQLKYFDDYTLTGCLLECRTQHVYDQCGCRLFYLPGDDDYCAPADIVLCALRVLAEVTSGNYTCECPTPCDMSLFQTTVSYSGWPNKKTAEYYYNTGLVWDGSVYDIPSATTYMGDNWVVLDVFFDKLNYKVIEQQREMTEGDLLSGVGGQLGLFIGASVITIFEFVEYLLLRFTWCCRKKNKVSAIGGVSAIDVAPLPQPSWQPQYLRPGALQTSSIGMDPVSTMKHREALVVDTELPGYSLDGYDMHGHMGGGQVNLY